MHRGRPAESAACLASLFSRDKDAEEADDNTTARESARHRAA
jgi:hypothetical protein